MDDLIILIILAIITGLYLIHRSVSGTLLEKAQLLSALASQPTLASLDIADLPNEPPSPVPNYSLSTASPRISRALWRGVELLIADFVDPWYAKISNQSDFPNDIRHMFDRSFNAIAVRARRVDWTAFIVRNILTNLNYLLRIYRLTEQHLHKTDPFFSNPRTPQHVRHKLMIEELQRAYRLHPGVGDRDGYLRVVSGAVLSRILTARDWRCEGMRDLLREMMIAYCLRVAMSFVEPYWLNVSLINGLNKMQESNNSMSSSGSGATTGTADGANGTTAGSSGSGEKAGKKDKRSARKKEQRQQEDVAPSHATPPLSRPTTADASGRPISSAAQPIPISSAASATTATSTFTAHHGELSTSAPKLSPVLHDGTGEGSLSAPTSPFPLSTSSHSSEAEGEGSLDGEDGEVGSDGEHPEGEWVAESKTHTRDHSSDSRSDGHTPGEAAETKEAADEAKNSGEASRKESLLTQKMLEWNNEREKRKEHELALAAAAHSTDGQPIPHSSSAMTTAHSKPPAHPTSSTASSSSASQPSSKRPSATASSTSHPPTTTRSVSTVWPASNTHLILPPSFLPNFTSIPIKAITSNWEVTIIGSGMKFDPKPFVAYQLAVKNGTLLGQIVSWTMIKRYTHFQHLHSQLKRKMEGVFSATLPKKHFFNQLDAEFIAQRRKELSTYLNQLLWNKEVLSSNELRLFLIPNERDFKDLLKWGGNTNVMTPQAAAAALSIGDPTIPLSRPATAQAVPGAAVRSPALAGQSGGGGGSTALAHSPSTSSVTPPVGTPISPAFLPAAALRTRSANFVDDVQHAGSSSISSAVTFDTSRSIAHEFAATTALPSASPMLTAVQSANGYGAVHPASNTSSSSSGTQSGQSSAANTPLLSSASSVISPPSTPRTTSMLTQQRPSSPRPPQSIHIASATQPLPPPPQSAVPHQPQSQNNTPTLSSTTSHLPATPPRLPLPQQAAPRSGRRASRSTPTSATAAAAAAAGGSTHRPRKSQYAAAHFEKEMSESLYRLIEELFDLNSRSFVRRQALWLGKQAVKLTANTMVTGMLRDTIAQAVSEQSITAQIEWMTDLLWPGGQYKSGGEPVTEEMKAETKAKAREMLLAAVPGPLQTLFGSGHCERSMERFFAFLQMEPLIQHFALSVLDMLVLTLFPELKAMIKAG